MAGNQRLIQIRISTMCIFRASQKLLCFNTGRKLLSFQVLCSKPTVHIDYYKRVRCRFEPVSGGKKVTIEEKQVFKQRADSCRSIRSLHGPAPALFNFTVIFCRYNSSWLSCWWWAMFQQHTHISEQYFLLEDSHIKPFIKKRNSASLEREKKKKYIYFKFCIGHLSNCRVRTKSLKLLIYTIFSRPFAGVSGSIFIWSLIQIVKAHTLLN